MAQALARNDALVDSISARCSDRRRAVALNTAFMGDGIVIHVAAGAASSADPSRVRRDRRQAGRAVHALARRVEKGARCDAGQSH
jgi:hypothetical protein